MEYQRPQIWLQVGLRRIQLDKLIKRSIKKSPSTNHIWRLGEELWKVPVLGPDDRWAGAGVLCGKDGGWGHKGKIYLNHGEPWSQAREFGIYNVDSQMPQVEEWWLPTFLSRNILGIAFWLEIEVVGWGRRFVLEPASKSFYLIGMFTWGWLLERVGGKDLRSYPKATLHSNCTVFTWMTSLFGVPKR